MDFENYRHIQQLTFFFLLTESGYRHGRGHPPAFLILSYSDKGCGPTVHALPLPINLHSFTTSCTEMSVQVGKVMENSTLWKHFPFLLYQKLSLTQRSSHIPTSAQIFPIDSYLSRKMKPFPCCLSFYIQQYVYVNPKLLIYPSSPPLPLANSKDLLESPGNSTQYSVVTYLGKELKNNGYVCN